jgi:hypothetical protein
MGIYEMVLCDVEGQNIISGLGALEQGRREENTVISRTVVGSGLLTVALPISQ